MGKPLKYVIGISLCVYSLLDIYICYTAEESMHILYWRNLISQPVFIKLLIFRLLLPVLANILILIGAVIFLLKTNARSYQLVRLSMYLNIISSVITITKLPYLLINTGFIVFSIVILLLVNRHKNVQNVG
jgi:hypothetical protein